METAEEAKNRDWQDMMDEVYEYWNEDTKNRTRISSAKHFGSKHVIAVRLGNFNYQVDNGGTSQWVHNGYAEEDLEPLIEFFNKALSFGLNKFSSLHNNTLKDILELLTDLRKWGNPNSESWMIDCQYCDGEGTEEESETDEVYNCFHCGGTGLEETKTFSDVFSNYCFSCIEKQTIFKENGDACEAYSFYIWGKSLFQELLNNYEEIEDATT